MRHRFIMSSRFDYVAYDDFATKQQKLMKDLAQTLEGAILGLNQGRAQSLALTSLEECYMWIGKQIRDDQIKRNGTAPLQEGRTNS